MSSTDPSATWYYGSGTERKGPFSKEQMLGLVQAGVVGTSTLVWSPEMPNWAPFGSSNLAREVPVAAPPPVPPLAGQFAPAAAYPAAAGYGQPSSPGVTGFGEAIKVCFSKYVTFSGRANRPEYWYFVLFLLIVSVVTVMVDFVVFNAASNGVTPLNSLFSLAIFLPSLAVTVRRLHDTDRSGWWYFIALVPLVGIIALLVFLCQAGTPGRNRFG